MSNTFTCLTVTSKLASQSDQQRLRIVLGVGWEELAIPVWVSVFVAWNAKGKK